MRKPILFLFLSLVLLPALPGSAAGEDALRPIDQVLKGKFVSLEKGRIVVRYDLSDPAQLEDFVSTKPFRVAGDLEMKHENKTMRLKGVGAWCHRAAFDRDVSMEVKLKPWKDRDLGIVIMEMEISDQWTLFSLNDIYFQKFDGAKDPSHMITRFGIRDDSDRPGDFAFRYIARGKSPDIRRFQPITIKAEKNGVDDRFTIGDRDYSGVEMGRKLLDMQIGFYLVESEAVIEEVVISGKVAPRWLEKEKVELRLSKPVDGEEPESEAAKEARAKLEQFAAGEIGVRDLLDVISNEEVPEEIREEAVEAVKEAGDKSVVPHLVPLLYSTDLTTRELAYDLVRRLAGRSFGYSPKANEKKRSEAVQKLIEYIQKNASDFR